MQVAPRGTFYRTRKGIPHEAQKKKKIRPTKEHLHILFTLTRREGHEEKKKLQCAYGRWGARGVKTWKALFSKQNPLSTKGKEGRKKGRRTK